MKNKVYFSLSEYLIYLPVIFTVLVFCSEIPLYILLVSLYLMYPFGFFTARILKKKGLVYPAGVLWSLLMIWVFAQGLDFSGKFFVFLISILLYMRGIIWLDKTVTEGIPQGLIFVLLPFSFFFLYLYSKSYVLRPYIKLFSILTVIQFVISFFLFNRLSIAKNAPLRKLEEIPQNVILKNKLMVFICIAFITVVSFWNLLTDVIVKATKVIFNFLITLLNSIFALKPVELERFDEELNPQMILPIEERSYTFIDYILIGILIISLTFLAYKLLRFLPDAFKKIIITLKKFMKSSNKNIGYVDSQESLINWNKTIKSLLNRMKKKRKYKLKDQRYDKIKSNKDRIRFLYRRHVLVQSKKGYTTKIYNTAGETIEEINGMYKQPLSFSNELKNAYNLARYSENEIVDDTVSRLKNEII